MSRSHFSLPSFAKINWSLRILGRRPDGYHELRTVLQTISLCDDLHFAARDDGPVTLTCDDPQIPTDEGNLIIRAALALRDLFQVRAGATIHLEKRIPAQGGLGGGSSNAAIALLGLAHLWSLTVDREELNRLGAALGADVPFFFVGGRSLATGTGTELKPLPDAPKSHLVVITPNAGVSTSAAYQALRARALTTSDDASILSNSCWPAGFQASAPERLHNDFEPTVFELEPQTKSASESLWRAGASGVLLAGSGSSVFGMFDNKEAQQRALREIPAEPGWRICAAATLSRHEYWAALRLGGVSFLDSVNLGADTGA